MSESKKPSYLLVLNGSAEAQAAAGFAWGLADKTGAQVIAQQVIDVPAIWHFLNFKLPGLVGSGVYFEAEKKIAEALRSMADTVFLSYQTQAEGHGIKIEGCIDEGDTIAEICRRAEEHDLVIVGRLDDDGFGPQDASFSFRLTKDCRKPVVFVKLEDEKVHLSVANESFDEEAVLSVCEFAESMAIPVDAKLASRSAR